MIQQTLIFNQISDKVIKRYGPTKEVLEEKILNELKKSKKLGKKPSSILILEEDRDLHDEDNQYLPEGNEKNRLLGFIKNLKANNIKESQVKPIDVRDVEEIRKDLEKEYERLLKEREPDDRCCAIQ